MAYKLIGKNFTPHDVVAKVTGRAKYAEDFRADGMVFCKMLTQPDAARPDPQHRRLGCAEDAGRARHSDRRRRAAIPAAAAADPRQGRGLLCRRSDPGARGRRRNDRRGRARKDQDRLRAAAACARSARQPVSRAGRTRARTAMWRRRRSTCRRSSGTPATSRDDKASCRWASRPSSGAMAISTPASRQPR